MTSVEPSSSREPIVLTAVWAVLCILSGIAPNERLIWFMEVLPVLLALAILIPTYRRFRFTPLVYRLIFIHACILTLGAKYTYAEVPLGFWVQDAFGLARNHYDRLGHVAQGFFPAIVAREVLLRTSPLTRGKWLFFLVACVCLAFSAVYELIEWWVAVFKEEAADSFLGAQGDVWDTQWDMFLCLLGALASLTFLSRYHDRELVAAGHLEPNATA